MFFLKSSINIMRSYFRSDSCFSCVIVYAGLSMLGWFQVTLVYVAYVLMLASHHLIISSATCPCYIWLESVLPVILVVRTPQSSIVSVILWSYDPEILDLSELLGVKLHLGHWDHGMTKLLWSCDPGFVRTPGSGVCSACCGEWLLS